MRKEGSLLPPRLRKAPRPSGRGSGRSRPSRRGWAPCHEALATPEETADDAVLLGQGGRLLPPQLLQRPGRDEIPPVSRACFHPEAVNVFRLGYANRTLGYRVPPQETAAGRELKARLQALGVLRQETGHEHLNGCVVFPITDTAGQVVQLYGRRIVAGADPRHLYLTGPQRGVWNAGALLPGADWILCEALIDALTLWCHGWRGVTASYGVHGFGPDHWALLAERKPGRLVIAYDADTAGHTQAAALARELAAKGVAVWRAAIPEGKDINDVAREADDPAAALRAVIDGAKKIAGRDVVPAPEMPAASLLRGVDAAASSHTDTGAPSSLAATAANASAAKKKDEPVPVDPCPSVASVVKQDSEEIVLACGDRLYRVRGLAKNTGFEALKVSLRVACGETWHLDTLDLAQAKQRAAFVEAAADETGLKAELLKRDLGRVLLKLEELQEARLRAQVAPEPAGPKIDRGRTHRRPRTAPRSQIARSDPGRLRGVRRGGRGDEQTCRLPRGRLAQARSAAGRHPSIDERGGEDGAHGVRPRIRSAGGADQILGTHGPGALLPRGRGPAAQDPGHRRGGGRGESLLRPETFAERGRTDHREHRQGPSRPVAW